MFFANDQLFVSLSIDLIAIDKNEDYYAIFSNYAYDWVEMLEIQKLNNTRE